MKNTRLIAAGCAAALAAASTLALADRFPENATFTTRALIPFAIEGLTNDAAGNLYTTGRQTNGNKKCPVWRINPDNGQRVTVAFIPNRPQDPPNPVPAGTTIVATPCNPSGITFDRFGDLYIADAAIEPGINGFIWKVKPAADGCTSDDSTVCPSSIPTAMAFATNVPGTNGLAFDRDGNLWTGDGTTARGRVWRIEGTGAVCDPNPNNLCREVFRIQPMRNGTDLGGDISEPGVGRENRTVPTGTAQNLVANGLAFTPDGDLYIADTARGAIWKVQFDRHGNMKSRTNCDTTFTDNTLCLQNIFVAHPFLEGTDGIALDRAGNIWNSANERNAIVVVTTQGGVLEVFRNPVNSAGLRNAADPMVGNNHILETPTSPVLAGTRFCTANSDGNRRDNSPATSTVKGANVGEIGGVNLDGTNQDRGKISCMDQKLEIPGLPLPVH
jgi:sugar lactone lactonase YvrE